MGKIALAGSRRLRSTLAAAPVLFTHAVVTIPKSAQTAQLIHLSNHSLAEALLCLCTAEVKQTRHSSQLTHGVLPIAVVTFQYATGYLRFHPLAQRVVHALKDLACRAPVLLAHAEVTKTSHIFHWVQNFVPNGNLGLSLPFFVCACRTPRQVPLRQLCTQRSRKP